MLIHFLKNKIRGGKQMPQRTGEPAPLALQAHDY
jgi:hypothetical protein